MAYYPTGKFETAVQQQPVRSSEIEREIEHMRSELLQLEDALGALASHIAPVLILRPGQDRASVDIPEPASELGGKLRALTDRISTLASHILHMDAGLAL